MTPEGTGAVKGRAKSPRRTIAQRLLDAAKRVESAVPVILLAAMSILPLLDFAGRLGVVGKIPGSSVLVQQSTLWLALLGAALAARFRRLLALALVTILPRWVRERSSVFVGMVGAAVSATLCWGSVEFVRAEHGGGNMVALGIPLWATITVMPVGFGIIAVRLAWNAAPAWRGRLLAAAGMAVPFVLGFLPQLQSPESAVAGVGVVLLATLLGLPIFAALAGLAIVLFWCSFEPVAAVPLAAYQLTAKPMLPAIPLFTMAGYILAEGGSCQRLVRVFRALVGWLPGGLAIVTVAVFAFFTSFTGASGVTILSLGGLLLPVLIRSKYPSRFSIGLVTTSGSIGLLFPPSLPVILYGVYSQTAIDELFIGGLLPGLLLVLLVSAWGFRQGLITGAGSQRLRFGEMFSAMWEAKWELLLPVMVVAGVFGGFMTLVETAALTVVYTLVVEGVIYNDLSVRRDFPRIAVECATLVGGVLVILGAAMGFTNYLIDAGIPEALVTWVKGAIQSPLAFLLVLNLFLLVVGCLMDIYSAILVVVPLIVPIGAAFGIHPVHLGVIFLTNLELGYMTPPVGINLFLAAYRFNRPLWQIVRATIPFLIIRIGGVLLISYVPWISLGLLAWLGKL